MDTNTEQPIIPIQNDTPRYRNRFPVLWQIGILVLLIGGLFTTGVVTWLTPAADPAWVERTAAPQPTSLMTTSNPTITDIALTGSNIFVYDVLTNRVIYQKDADVTVPLASITKLMTALVAHELIAFETTTNVPLNATRQQSASGLMAGEELRVDALTDYALLASSNDAAYTLAAAVGESVAGTNSEEVLVKIMNERARELTLPTLTFRNTTGLDISPTEAGGYGSARDVTFLLAYLYREYPELLESTTLLTTEIPNEAGGYHNARNTNRIISQIPNIIGSKTGYTDLAGGNLTVIYDAGFGRPIIITVLGSTFFGRFDDVATIVEAVNEALIAQ